VAELLSFVKNSKWRLFAILNYCVAMLDHPRSLYGDQKLVFKFRVDPFCSFEDIVNRKFCKCGLKRLSRPPKFTFLGVLTPKHYLSSLRPPKRHYLGGKHGLSAIVCRNRSSGMATTRCEEYTNKKTNKQRVEPKLWQTGCSPRSPP